MQRPLQFEGRLWFATDCVGFTALPRQVVADTQPQVSVGGLVACHRIVGHWDALGFLQDFVGRSVHDKVQQAQPQTVAHALADSPAGQLAWSGQLFGDALSPDEILTNVSIYWLTNTAASAARIYYEDAHAEQPTGPTTVPTGLASFANDFRPIRRFAERDHENIVSWSEFDRGGHWAAHDAPEILVGDIRQFFRGLR